MITCSTPTQSKEPRMARKNAPTPSEVARLRAELEGRSTAKGETKPFVAHGGKPPAPPRK